MIELSRKDYSMLNRARTVATTSTHRFKHGAVLADHGKVVAVGVNVTRNNPRNVEFRTDASIHAEVAALNSVRGETQGLTLYVARIKKNGDAAESRPCAACQSALSKAGIKRVIYTTSTLLNYGVWNPGVGA